MSRRYQGSYTYSRSYSPRRGVDPVDVLGGVLTLMAVAVVGGLLWVVLSEDEPDMVAACVNPSTNERVVDELCGGFEDTGSGVYVHPVTQVGYSYMFFDTRAYPGPVPAVGQRMPPAGTTGFVRSYKTGTKVGKGIPVDGSPNVAAAKPNVVRGGFGVKGAGSGGG